MNKISAKDRWKKEYKQINDILRNERDNPRNCGHKHCLWWKTRSRGAKKWVKTFDEEDDDD